MPATLDQVLAAVNSANSAIRTVNLKLDVLMSQQDAIDTAVQALAATLTDVQGDAATLVTDVTAIAAKIAAGETVDITALNALVVSAQSVQAALDSATASVTALAAPPAA